MIPPFEFREPLWLLLALVPILFLSLGLLLKRQRSSSYADPILFDWVIVKQREKSLQHAIQLLLLQFSWLLMAIAIAGPRSSLTIPNLQQENYHEVIAIVDVSLSMSARDTLPSRIERAKLELLDFVDQIDNVRLAIIVHAANPHILNPLTADKNLLRHYISTIHTSMLPTEGSRPFSAILSAQQYFSASNKTSKSIIYLSDGEQHDNDTLQQQAMAEISSVMEQRDIYLYSLGIGSLSGAPIISVNQDWLKQHSRSIVTKLDPRFLEQLATVGNGKFIKATDDNRDWNELYHNGIAQLDNVATEVTSDDDVVWQEHFHWFAIAAMCLLLASITRLPIRSLKLAPHHNQLVTFGIILIALYSFSPNVISATASQTSQHKEIYQQAIDKYKAKDLQAARSLLAQVPGYPARFAEGVIHYHLEQYQLAIPAFIQATLDANSDTQRHNAIFNLANCYFKLDQFQQARSLYQDVLRYSPNNKSAKINLEYATALAKKLEEESRRFNKGTGRGPVLVDVESGLDITGPVTLSDSENNTSVEFSSNEELTQDNKAILAQSRLASEHIDKKQDPSWTYDINTIDILKSQPIPVSVDEAIIWKRLFEVEEGFDAAQDEPNVIPGVKSW